MLGCSRVREVPVNYRHLRVSSFFFHPFDLDVLKKGSKVAGFGGIESHLPLARVCRHHVLIQESPLHLYQPYLIYPPTYPEPILTYYQPPATTSTREKQTDVSDNPRTLYPFLLNFSLPI